METITQKIGDAKKSLMELEREAKSKGKQLNNYILDYKEYVCRLSFSVFVFILRYYFVQ